MNESVAAVLVISLVLAAVVLAVFLGVGDLTVSGKEASLSDGSDRRGFLVRVGQVVGLAVVALIARPMTALAAAPCTLGCTTNQYKNTCRGRCSCVSSSVYCCSPSGTFCDTCTGGCGGSGCCTQPRRRVVFTVANNGCCFCYLETC